MIQLKILFKNTTKYSEENYAKFLQFHDKKYSFSYKLYTIVIIMLILYCIIAQVKYHNYSIAIIFCIALTLFFLWRFFHPITLVQKELKSDTITKEKSFTFRFYERSFTIQSNKIFARTYYSKLYKVFETNDFFYLYVDKEHAYLIDKSTFSIGTPKEFSEFIKKKTFIKFKNTEDKK